jgi:hypothetical protein
MQPTDSRVQQPHVLFLPSSSDALSIAIRNLRSAPFWDITQGRVVVPYGRFGTTYRYHPQGSIHTRRNLLGYPRTAQTNRGLVCVAYWTAFRGSTCSPWPRNQHLHKKQQANESKPYFDLGCELHFILLTYSVE